VLNLSCDSMLANVEHYEVSDGSSRCALDDSNDMPLFPKLFRRIQNKPYKYNSQGLFTPGVGGTTRTTHGGIAWKEPVGNVDQILYQLLGPIQLRRISVTPSIQLHQLPGHPSPGWCSWVEPRQPGIFYAG